jgi:acetyl-CoA synthetase
MNSSPQERTEKADWTPTPETIYSTNIAWLMQRVGVDSYEALHRWSVQHREEFWAAAIART